MLLKMQKEGLEKANVKLSHPRHAKKYNSIKQKRKKANKKQIQKKSKIKQQKTPKRAITYNMLFCFVFALEKNAAVKKQLVLCTFSFMFLLFVFALFFALFERLISCGAFLLALFFNTFFERWTRTGFHKIHQDLSTRNILWRVYYFIYFLPSSMVHKGRFCSQRGWRSGIPMDSLHIQLHQAPGVSRRRERKSGSSLVKQKPVSPLVKVNELREKNGLFGLYVDLYREFYVTTQLLWRLL